MRDPDGKEWLTTHPGVYTRDGYSIMRAAPGYGRAWILRLHGSVFGLRVPSRFLTVADAMIAAARDERIRSFAE